MPWSIRCQAVDLYCLRQRAGEEVERVKADTLNALRHFVSLHDQLASAAAADNLCAGLRALLLGRAQTVRCSVASLWAVGQPLLKDSLDQSLTDRCVTLSCSSASAPAMDLDSADCDDQSDTESTDSGEDE